MENNNNFFERDHEETEKRNSTKIKMEIDQEFLRKTKKLFGLTLAACAILAKNMELAIMLAPILFFCLKRRGLSGYLHSLRN